MALVVLVRLVAVDAIELGHGIDDVDEKRRNAKKNVQQQGFSDGHPTRILICRFGAYVPGSGLDPQLSPTYGRTCSDNYLDMSKYRAAK